jgi:hypothetical protein
MKRDSIPEQQLRILEEILHEIRKQTPILIAIADALTSPPVSTPLTIVFQESSMLPPVAGNTLVYTGTLSPDGSQFPAGTTFTVSSNYPNVTPTVDATGLIVTIPLGSDFVDDPGNPLAVRYLSSTFVPVPDTSPAAVSATITPTIPTPTPVGISFVQTT